MKNVFVQTENARGFMTSIKEAEKITGVEPSFLVFHGQAGRGKTSAARYFAAQEGWTYARALKGWSELWMLQDLCFELAIDPIPGRKKTAFEALTARLMNGGGKPVIIDEADKLSDTLLEWIRDLADTTAVPFALVGEKLIMHSMQKERRIWSRTTRAMEFGPVSSKDILFFAKQAAEMTLTAQQAEMLRQASDGDFRLVSRDVRRIEELAEVNKIQRISDDLVKLAIKQGLRGA